MGIKDIKNTKPNSHVPPGYKQTEIGVLPEDWEVKRLGDVAEINKERKILRNQVVKYIDIESIKNNKIIDYKIFNNIDEAPIRARRRVEEGDIIYSTVRPYLKAIAIINNKYNGFICSSGFAVISPLINNSFLFYYLQSNFFTNKQVLPLIVGSNYPAINPSDLKNLYIPLPPKSEQQAIAEVLSDMGALIEALDRKIEKKKNILKGAMQELLTGRRRLPGFSGKWERKKLGEVAKIKKGDIITQKEIGKGNIPVIAGGIKPSYFTNKPNRLKNTITISASGANAGYVSYHNYPIFASDCSTIEEEKGYHLLFLFYSLKFIQSQIYSLQTGGAQPHIYPIHIQNLEIDIPPTLEEQQAIAQVLSDMDEEIEALEKKKAKYEMIKQGAMEVLLTGKVRLIESKPGNTASEKK